MINLPHCETLHEHTPSPFETQEGSVLPRVLRKMKSNSSFLERVGRK